MDALKRQIMKARKASKFSPEQQKFNANSVKVRYELDEMFSGQYISESMGLYSKEIIMNCQQSKRKYLKQSLDNTKHRSKRSVILEYRRQYDQTFSEPLGRKQKKKRTMEIELKTFCKQESKSEEQIMGNISIDVVQRQSAEKDQSKSQSKFRSMPKITKSQNTVKNQQIMQKVQKQQSQDERADKVSGEKSLKTCPSNPSQQPSGTKTSKSYITDSVYHNEDSVWKKYLVDDIQWQHPTTTQQSFPELNPIQQLQKQTESAPTQPEQNKITYNQSLALIKDDKEITEMQNTQPQLNRKSQKQKPQSVDLMTLDQMRGHYDSYSPVFFPEEEIEMFVSALDNTEYEQSCINYLDKVYQKYHKNGGTMVKRQVQQKIVCDLMFVIRQENLKCCFKTQLS